MSRTSSTSLRFHAALIAVAAALMLAAPTEAQGVIGGRLFATGGTVDILVQPGTAAFTSRLFLQHPDRTRTSVALNTEVGKHVTVGPFPAGEELVFGIIMADQQPFLMGPASRNPDGIAHAEVTETGVRTFLVGFEDQFGGGDRDYDDTVFQFTGNLAPTRPPSAGNPTPTTPTTPNPESDVPPLESKVRPLRIAEARRRLPGVLRKRYGKRYTRRRGPLKKFCYRLSTEKVHCRVRWKTRRHRYAGKATMWRERRDPDTIVCTTAIRRTRPSRAQPRTTRIVVSGIG
jgi:hypothetical protein